MLTAAEHNICLCQIRDPDPWPKSQDYGCWRAGRYEWIIWKLAEPDKLMLVERSGLQNLVNGGPVCVSYVDEWEGELPLYPQNTVERQFDKFLNPKGVDPILPQRNGDSYAIGWLGSLTVADLDLTESWLKTEINPIQFRMEKYEEGK